MTIRPATADDSQAIAAILIPVVRAGDTYTVPRDMTVAEALAYWFEPDHEVFVACDRDEIVGTYFLRPNQRGGGSHVANCGYITSRGAEGRGIGRAMCEHSLARAAARGFRAMQFNFVVSTNDRAVRLWQDCGFEIVGRLPAAFEHPTAGYVDALVMFRPIAPP